MFSVIYVRTECSVRTVKTVVQNKEWSKLQCFRQRLLALCGVHSAQCMCVRNQQGCSETGQGNPAERCTHSSGSQCT